MGLKPVSVSRLNAYIKRILQSDPILGNVSVIGEISNLKYHSSGHVYFTLKDENSKINCFLSADQRRYLRYELDNGMEITASGYIYLYERGGSYSLNVNNIEVSGLGDLQIAFQQLKDKLQKEGLFDPQYKKPLPSYPKKVAVVTSPTGAAVRDVISIITNRWPLTDILVCPCLVQGPEAARDVAGTIEAVNAQCPDVDVMIVGRGGGSMEDLWAFNEEEVARAIFQCSVPIISAVGHETDVTIADYVADLRAPTPSAAAELAVYDFQALLEQLETNKRRLNMKMTNELMLQKRRLQYYQTKLGYLSPESMIRERRMRLLQLEEKMQNLMKQEIIKERHRLNLYIEKMKGLSPLNKLNQGFSYVENQEHQAVTSVTQVQKEDSLCINVKDGKIWTRVERIEVENG